MDTTTTSRRRRPRTPRAAAPERPRGLHEGVCDQCRQPGLVQDYTESLSSRRLEGTFCSSECANAHQLARVGRLL